MIESDITTITKLYTAMRGAVGRSDLIAIGAGTMRASDGVWACEAPIPGSKSFAPVVLSYSKLGEILHACSPDSAITFEHRGSRCVVRSRGAAWVLNVRSDQVPPYPNVEGAAGRGSGPSLVDTYASLKHLIRPDLSRPGLMFGYIKDKRMMVGDGSRLGIRICYVDDLEIPLIVFQELSRILRLSPCDEFLWTEGEEFYSFDLGGIRFAAKKLAGHFEREWSEEMEAQTANSQAKIWVATTEFLQAVSQALVVNEEFITLQGGETGLLVEAQNQNGERSVSKVVVDDGDFSSISSVVVAAKDLKTSLQARADRTCCLSIGPSFLKLSDTISSEILTRRTA